MTEKKDSVLNYNISLTIDGKPQTKNLKRVQIVSSIAAPYPNIHIDIFSDPNDAILDAIYGQHPIKLTIEMNDPGEIFPSEHIEMELMYLHSNTSMPIKPSLSEGKFQDRTLFSLITVPRKSYKAMSTIINDIFIGKTPTEIVTEIVSSTDCKLVMDSDDKNLTKIRQVIIPPTSLYKTIEFLDYNYGLYLGASNYGYCQYDNKFLVMNLTKRMNKAQNITIYHLSTDSVDASKIIKESLTDKVFYTTGSISGDYSGNTMFASLATKSHIITKPFNKLYSTQTFDLTKICSDYGVCFNNKKVQIDPILNSRETYVTEETGYENSEVSVSDISRKIMGLATVKVNLGKNMPILSLINVGDVVKLNTKTVEYKDLSGKYILSSSNIVLVKDDVSGWMANCDLNLMRTNKTI